MAGAIVGMLYKTDGQVCEVSSPPGGRFVREELECLLGQGIKVYVFDNGWAAVGAPSQTLNLKAKRVWHDFDNDDGGSDWDSFNVHGDQLFCPVEWLPAYILPGGLGTYRVMIRGQADQDDGLEIDMGCPTQRDAWWELPIPACPDCGGRVDARQVKGEIFGECRCGCGSVFLIGFANKGQSHRVTMIRFPFY